MSGGIFSTISPAPKNWLIVIGPTPLLELNEKPNDVAFIITAVNSNAKLREIIRVQREALELIAENDRDYETELKAFKRARQALEAAERVCEERG